MIMYMIKKYFYFVFLFVICLNNSLAQVPNELKIDSIIISSYSEFLASSTIILGPNVVISSEGHANLIVGHQVKVLPSINIVEGGRLDVIISNFTPPHVKDDNIFPNKLILFQNYPNPFNPITTIKYTLPEQTYFSLKIYNTLGKEIAILYKGEKTSGLHEAVFNGNDLSSGIYFCVLKANKWIATKKMVLLK